MKRISRLRPITRRDFLIMTGLTGAALASGCSRRSSAPPASGGESAGGKAVLYATAKPPPAPSGTPDWIFRNGRVITVDAADTIAQALAVRDGRIQAVGSNESIEALKGPETQVFELNGRSLTPGLIDPHLHLGVIALVDVYTPFIPPDVTDIASLQKKLKEVAAQTPEGEWILGYIIQLDEIRAPTAKELDVGTSKHPVWIIHIAGHLGSANSLAMQLAGIDENTQTPEGGMMPRDKNGMPTGEFYTHRTMDLLRSAIPKDLIEADPRGILQNQMMLAAQGLTSIHDVYVRGVDIIKAYYGYGKSGQMKLRCSIMPILEQASHLEIALKMERYTDEMFRLGGFKLQIDGQGPTAYTKKPHDGVAWDKPYWDPKVFKQIVRTLHSEGYQISIHSVGDAALELVLDAYEAALNADPRPNPRHRIEHCILSDATQHRRIKDLGLLVSESPTFLAMAGDYYLQHYGRERQDLIVRSRDWLELGIPLSINSDYPSTPWYTPQMNMAAAVQRISRLGKVITADQALTMMEALRAQTMGAAYAGFDESQRGSIEPGKQADLAIWTKDPLGMTGKEMEAATVDATFVAGKQVYPAA